MVEIMAGTCDGVGQARSWADTKSAAAGIQQPTGTTVFTPKSVTLVNGDTCTVDDWVVWVQSTTHASVSRIGRAAEIIQLVGAAAQRKGAADFILISQTIIGEPHSIYKMRRLESIADEYFRVPIKHLAKGDLIVNTAQMRDAAALNAFHWVPNALVTADIIRTAATKAFADRQKKKSADTAAADSLSGSKLEPPAKKPELRQPHRKHHRQGYRAQFRRLGNPQALFATFRRCK
ncbi:hypothetical protein C8R45DRAFT_933740 [Mycena sanguinolenta]|nr:hypothetical protein C8R45DRAFT_933740 [Mycena sanguinolenta]